MGEAKRRAAAARRAEQLVALQRRLEAAIPAPPHAPVDDLNERIRVAETHNHPGDHAHQG